MTPRKPVEITEDAAGRRKPAMERAMLLSGFCAFPSTGSHGYCHERLVADGHPCLCECHDQTPPPSMEGFGTPLDQQKGRS